MSRDLLRRAAEEVDAAGESSTDPEAADRLSDLADQLRSQADRDATPALGAIARVDAKLREIADDADDRSVEDRIDRARDRLLSFLGTLEDRGMKQHGWTED